MLLLLVWLVAIYIDRLSFLPEVKWSDVTGKAMLLYLIIYKFSPALFSPKSILIDPRAILFFSGDIKSVLLAAAVTGVYLWFLLRDRKINGSALIEVLTLHALLVFAGYNLLFRDYGIATSMPWGIRIQDGGYHYHPLHFYRLIILVCLYLYWRWRRKKSESSAFYPFLFIFGVMSLLLVTYLDYPPAMNLFFSFEQTIYIAFAILGWLSMILKQSRSRKENE